MFTTPILFCIYNCPDITRLTFAKIKKIKPKNLYIAADGPKNNNYEDLLRCKKTREIINEINWSCKFSIKYSKNNLGLKSAMISSLNWFFKKVPYGIILEHDCLADPDFFYFCDVLLKRYKKNKLIFSISGNNLQNGKWIGDGDYYFSSLFGCWGWATWRRAWIMYQNKLKKYEEFKKADILNAIGLTKRNQKLVYQSYDSVFNNSNKTTWSFNFEYAQICARGMTIVPNANLVSNIGFGKHATNAKEAGSHLANMKINKLPGIKKPSLEIPNIEADNRQLSYAYKVKFRIRLKNLLRRIVKFILPAWITTLLKKYK